MESHLPFLRFLTPWTNSVHWYIVITWFVWNMAVNLFRVEYFIRKAERT